MDRGIEHQEIERAKLPAIGVPSRAVVGLLAVALPLSFAAAGTSVLPGDVETTRMIQAQLPGVIEPWVGAVNLLGSAPSMIAIALAVAISLLLKGRQRLALTVAAATLAQAANVVLKLTLESPRPTSALVHVPEQSNGFGFPSGHTMGTTVLALILFYVATTLMTDGIRLRLVQAGLLLIPLLVGVARIETGAHWPSDVLGAWLWGGLVAIAIVTTLQRPFNGLPRTVTRPGRRVNNRMAVGDLSGD